VGSEPDCAAAWGTREAAKAREARMAGIAGRGMGAIVSQGVGNIRRRTERASAKCNSRFFAPHPQTYPKELSLFGDP